MDLQDKQTALQLAASEKESLKARIAKGETGLMDDYERIVSLEARLLAEAEEPEGEDHLDSFRVKTKKRRTYTLSEAAIQARKDNAQKSTGPATEEGKTASARNAWKHGQYAKSRIMGFGKPCKSTCPKFPCSLVDGGDVSPGEDCLDKEHFLRVIGSLDEAMKKGDLTDIKEIAAVQLAGTIQVIQELQLSIIENGVYFRSAKLDKEGKPIGYEIKPNPSLLPLGNLLKSIGLTLPDFMLTPREVQRTKDSNDDRETLTSIFKGGAAQLAAAMGKKESGA